MGTSRPPGDTSGEFSDLTFVGLLGPHVPFKRQQRGGDQKIKAEALGEFFSCCLELLEDVGAMKVFILLFLIPGSCLYIPCRYHLCQATRLRTFSWLHHPRYNNSTRDFMGQEVAKIQSDLKDVQGDCGLVLPQVGTSHGGLYGLRLVALQRKSSGKLPWMHMVNVSITATSPRPNLWPPPASLTHGLRTTFGCWLPPTCPDAVSSLTWGPPGDTQTLGGVVDMWIPPASVTSDPAMGTSLTFTPRWDQDGTILTCSLRGDSGEVLSKVDRRLQVNYAPQNVHVEVTPASTVYEGQEVTLSCRDLAKPQSQLYSWTLNGQSLPHRLAHVHLSSTKASDGGTYNCWATNDLGTAESSPASLEVYYPPRGASLEALTPLPALEGSPISLRCSLGPAHPVPPTVQWLRDDAWQAATPGHTLTFWADPAHSGSYRCIGQNVAGSTQSPPLTVNVWYPPRSIQVQQLPMGPVRAGGGPVQLRCLVGGAEPPQLEVTWYKDGRLLTFDPKASESVTFDPVTFDLILGPPLPAEASSFSCHARNAAGGARSRPLQLDVLFTPVLTPPPFPVAPWGVQLEAEPGWVVPELSDIILRCHARSRPPPSVFSWYHNGHLLGTSKEGLWLLGEVGLGAMGHYHCRVSNQQGVAESPECILSVQVSSSTLLKRIFLGLGVTGAALLLGTLGALLWHWWQQRVAAEEVPEVAPGRTFCMYRKQTSSDIIGTSSPPPALIGCEPRRILGDPNLQRSPGACKAPEGPDYENLSPGATSGAAGTGEGTLVYATLALAIPRPPGAHREDMEDTAVDYISLRH
ncbi:B-cell receptor CD22-like [Indicator indicator]|uniref:B-cell receptor CD22-like n=1 Tax=Indicator indicator TaxID=1002788 RepID=UPI0023DF7160|nr:B-cell receptor CD22-like [Indicator indicator]